MADKSKRWDPAAYEIAKGLHAQNKSASIISKHLATLGYSYSRAAVGGKFFRGKTVQGKARSTGLKGGNVSPAIAEPSPPKRFSWEREA